MHPSCAGLAAIPEGDWLCPEHAAAAEKRRAAKAEKAAVREKAPKKAKVAPGADGTAHAKLKTSSKKRDCADNESGGSPYINGRSLQEKVSSPEHGAAV